MSYILDALKKAERDRDIKQIPTIAAEHEPRTPRRKIQWAIPVLLVIIAGAATWFIISLRQDINPPLPSPAVADYSRSQPDSGATQIQTPFASPPTVQKSEVPDERSSAPSAAPRPNPAAPRAFPSAKTMDSERLREMANWLAAVSEEGDEVLEEAIPARVMERQRLLGERTRIPGVKAARQETETAPSKPDSLKEALNGMALSLLLYSDNKAERMVFINGRKYAEDELVEDTYLIESITEEGAVLSYRGERALLRPKTK